MKEIIVHRPQPFSAHGRNGWFALKHLVVLVQQAVHEAPNVIVLGQSKRSPYGSSPVVLKLSLDDARALVHAINDELNDQV